MWAWGLTVTLSLIVLAGAVAGFGYAGSAGWMTATRRPGIGRYGLRALGAGLIAVSAAELMALAGSALGQGTSVSPDFAAFPVFISLLGYPAGYVGGLLRRARSTPSRSAQMPR